MIGDRAAPGGTAGNAADRNRIFDYQYRATEYSLIGPYLIRFVCRKLLAIVPLRLSPNVLSLLANGISLLVFAFLVGAFGPVDRMAKANSLVFLLPAVGIFAYLAVDNTDGMHARRTGTSSPLGDFVDHWFDAFESVLLPLGVLAAVIKVDDVPFFWVMINCAGSQWAQNWDRLQSGKLLMCGDKEAIALVILVYLITAALGLETWHQPILGMELGTLIGVGVGCFFAITSVFTLIKHVKKAWQALGILSTMALPVAWYFVARSRGLVTETDRLLVASLIGLLTGYFAGELLRAHLIGLAYRAWDASSFLLGVALLATLWGAATRPPLDGRTILVASILVAIAKVLLQFLITVRYISTRLKLKLLSLTPEQERALAAGRQA